MSRRQLQSESTRYGRSFDFLLAIPLAVYTVIVILLVSSLVLKITPSAILSAVTDSNILDSIILSFVTSLISSLLSVAVAVPAGYILSRNRFPGRSIVDGLLDLPIALPPLVMGLALLVFFNTSAGRWIDRAVEGGVFVYRPGGIVLVQFIIGCALSVRVMRSGFDAVDARYEDVAMALGANRWQSFIKVAVPAAGSSIVASAVISWARIFGLFGPIILLCGTIRGRTEIMPTTIFLEAQTGRIDVALVMGACMIIASMVALAIYKRIGGKTFS